MTPFATGSAPASATEIRKEPQLYTVTPAMMHAIDTTVAERCA